MAKKNKAKKDKVEKRKNQKNEDAPPALPELEPEEVAPEEVDTSKEVKSPSLSAQKEVASLEDTEDISPAAEQVEALPEIVESNLAEIDNKDDVEEHQENQGLEEQQDFEEQHDHRREPQEQGPEEQQEPEELQPPEDWSMIAPHQPTIQDDDSASMKSKKHSHAKSVSGRSSGTAPRKDLTEEKDTFEDAKDESVEVVEMVHPKQALEERHEEHEAITDTLDAEHEDQESVPVEVYEVKEDDVAPEHTEEAPENHIEEAQEAEQIVPETEPAEDKELLADDHQVQIEEEPKEIAEEEEEEEEHQDHPEDVAPEVADNMSSKHSISGVSHAGPAPLPSPVPSEPRSVHSPAIPSDHPLSRHGSPMMYHTSPQYRYASPTMQAYSPYMMGMHPAQMHPGSVAPSSASFATAYPNAYHSPMMEHTPMASPHMYPRRSSTYANGARDYYNGRMDRTLSGGSGNSHAHSQRMEKTNSHTNNEDDHHEHHHLMGRVEKAMPDLSRMLDSFKETRNKLQAREAEFKQLQSQHEQAIMHKDFYIEALQGQMKKAATETAEEYGKFKDIISGLRVDLSNQQDRIKDLQQFLDTSRKQNEELEQIKSELESEIRTLEKRVEEMQMDHERALEEAKEHERAELSMQKEELTNLFEEIRTEDETAANERYNEREKELLEVQETLKSAWEEKHRELEEAHGNLKTEHDDKHAELERTLADLKAAKNDLQAVRDSLVSKSEDLETKENELETTKAELEEKLGEVKKAQDELHYKQEELQATQAELQSTLEELVTKKAELEGKHAELEDAHKRHAEEKGQLIGSHFTELDNIRDVHATEISNLRTTHETNAKELQDRLDKFAKDFDEKERTWAAEKTMLQRQLHEKLDELAGIEREKDALERDDVVRERHLQSAVEEMRRTIDNMENDREKLRKTLQSLGEATDLKSSKGDQFFVDQFGQLRRLIVELSKEHFSYLPIDPPKDILEKIPSEMPSFLDNTVASRELRSAYIQHVVSKTLTYRIFQPFLFTLGRRYDKADTFFQVLSMDIRRKSVRREAFWRQQTLKAAYTTSDAKQSINVVAAVIVDEIVDHIKHFADPKQLDALLSGIRRIVKLAAETWRHARVERELVLATMPAPESDGEVNEGWEEYTCGRSSPESSPSGSAVSGGRHVLLRVFPRIYREAAHEDFIADDKEKMNACVYFPGSILYSDSPSVLARREEQGQKGSVNGETTRSSSP
ncbi:uncharacterized protein BHQ10_008715 [Talaromyces amestolkiae]|uniref:Uncharacterized protein n=1 Tax=Talaromyces amestolkiae TaxID=1196081 RepID=A0A364LAA4_TALAM|nr:uncharacterized protein BHQ10_008715 [Talaromyces amestolkiae]RAO72703.1 hypothetical protein BHQ10_008715 [Talaromyces amestolkiae]